MPVDDPAALPPGVPLSDMIETLRSELQRSLQRGAGQAVTFDVEKVELELKVAVGGSAKAGGGVAFWVLKADAGGERRHELAHTFRLTLSPVTASTGARTRINAEASAGERPGDR